MAAGLVAISFSVAGDAEHAEWHEAARREQDLYRINEHFVHSALEGRSSHPVPVRKWLDWVIVAAATAAFVWTASMAQWPALNLNWSAVYILIAVGLALFVITAISLWRITRFN
jgi:hypothetical protein